MASCWSLEENQKARGLRLLANRQSSQYVDLGALGHDGINLTVVGKHENAKESCSTAAVSVWRRCRKRREVPYPRRQS
jgi:hypothetical protein